MVREAGGAMGKRCTVWDVGGREGAWGALVGMAGLRGTLGQEWAEWRHRAVHGPLQRYGAARFCRMGRAAEEGAGTDGMKERQGCRPQGDRIASGEIYSKGLVGCPRQSHGDAEWSKK